MSDFVDVGTEYAKDEKLKKEDVEQLREWARKQRHLPEITERQMVFFLHSCYYSNEAAKTCIENYYTVRAHCREFFTNRDLRLHYDEILAGLTYMPLPKLTPDGYKIFYCRLTDPNPDVFHFANLVKSFDMANTLMLHQEGTFKGEIVVADFWRVSMAHLYKFNPVLMKKFFFYFQEAMPVRIKSIHIINVPTFVETFVSMIKPFMKKDLFNSMKVHPRGLDDLVKIVPLDCLPKDVGGTLDSVADLRERWGKNMLAHADFFVDEEKAIANESKRVGKPKNESDIFGVEGSFKKLDID